MVDAIQAVLSWVNPAPMMPLLQALTAPMLDPIRRILPRTSIDFSPLVLLLIVAQVQDGAGQLSQRMMGSIRRHGIAPRS